MEEEEQPGWSTDDEDGAVPPQGGAASVSSLHNSSVSAKEPEIPSLSESQTKEPTAIASMADDGGPAEEQEFECDVCLDGAWSQLCPDA